MVMEPPNKKITIKEEYRNKLDALKSSIINTIDTFEKDTGCKVIRIQSNYDFGCFTFNIITDIFKD